MIWPFHPEISVPTFMTQDDFEWCVLTHKIYILWLRVHYFKGITGAPGSIPTAAIGLLLSETLFEIFSSLMCLLKAASCINIPKYYLTQNFIHFPPPTEDCLITKRRVLLFLSFFLFLYFPLLSLSWFHQGFHFRWKVNLRRPFSRAVGVR